MYHICYRFLMKSIVWYFLSNTRFNLDQYIYIYMMILTKKLCSTIQWYSSLSFYFGSITCVEIKENKNKNNGIK